MVRILSVIVVICGFFLAISFFRIKHLENKNTSLETQIAKNKAYYELQISKLKKEKENALEIIHSNEVLEKAIKEDNISFDWQFNISNSDAVVNLKRLHGNRI